MQVTKEQVLKFAIPVILLVGGGIFFSRQEQNDMTTDSFWESTAQTTVSGSTEATVCYADLKGAVAKPGMYRFKDGDRLVDLIEAAGGFQDEADQNQVNLAKRVQDQEVVYVPKQGEIIEQQNITAQPTDSGAEKININLADEKQLQELSGIGEKKAQDIVQYREQHGSFKSIEDLTSVSGIGEKTLDKLRDSITI